MVKVVCISLTFDPECPPALQRDYSQSDWAGRYSFDVSQENVDGETKHCDCKIITAHKHRVFIRPCFSCCVNNAGRERERAKGIALDVCVSVTRPAFILRCLCGHCCKLSDL